MPPPLAYAGAAINEIELFKDLGTTMHAKGLTPDLETLCKAAKRAMSGSHSQCQQLHIHDPIFRRKLLPPMSSPYCAMAVMSGPLEESDLPLRCCQRAETGLLKVLPGARNTS